MIRQTAIKGVNVTYRSKTRTKNVEYIQSLLGQLRDMAAAERCEMLTYLIEMAYVEASDVLRDGHAETKAEKKAA